MMNRFALCFTLAFAAGCSEPPAVPAPSSASGEPASPGDMKEYVAGVIAELMGIDRSRVEMDRPIGGPPLNADDLDLVELIMEIEEHFDVTIPDEELEKVSGAKPEELLAKLTPAHLATLAEQARERSAGKE